MISSAVARYDIRELLGTLNHELHIGDNNAKTQEHNYLWVLINLSEMYGLNSPHHITATLEWKAEQLRNAPRAREILFRCVKPPVFDYQTAPNFQCDVMIRKDEMLVLTFE